VVWAALGLLALTNIILVVWLYNELKERFYVIQELILMTERSLLNSDIEIEQKIKNIPKEMIIKNYLKIP
jgi:hypothetical protein